MGEGGPNSLGVILLVAYLTSIVTRTPKFFYFQHPLIIASVHRSIEPFQSSSTVVLDLCTHGLKDERRCQNNLAP